MAIDTQTKRQACINGVGHMFLSPPPDGEISATDIYFWVFLQVAVSEEEEIGDIEEAVNNILGVVTIMFQKVSQMERKLNKETDDNWKFLYSAIRDIRREVLRGNDLRRQ